MSVFGRWQPEISFQSEQRLEKLLAWNPASAGHPSRSQRHRTGADLFFDHLQKYSPVLPGPPRRRKDLMVHNDSQDGNISLLTEDWPWSMSRELSVGLYFRTYLQTSTHSLFWLLFFSPPGKSPEKILKSHKFLFLSMFCILMRLYTLCNMSTWVAFSSVRWKGHKLLTQRPGLWLLTAANPHYLLPVIDGAVRTPGVHSYCGGFLGAEIYTSSKNIWPHKYSVHLWEW